jgi:predicted nucleotidyltransferase
MKSLQDINFALKESRRMLFTKYPIERLAIFGSYARNEQTADSDVDLLVEFNGKIGIQFIDLANELERILGFKVDLVSKNGIKDKYFQEIEHDLIYV